jgi:hypothetical protein
VLIDGLYQDKRLCPKMASQAKLRVRILGFGATLIGAGQTHKRPIVVPVDD